MIDLHGREDIPVPEEVVAAVADHAHRLGITPLLIGAAARDLVVHAQQQRGPVRATKDIDIAIAVDGAQKFSALARALGSPNSGTHRFTVLGIEVDIVPFGGVERGREVHFPDDHVLDVTGIAEALLTSVWVRMPQGTEIRAADAPAQSALKILAWRDRRHTNAKDATDLRTILDAMSEDPFDDAVWNDTEALDATGYDIFAAAAYRTGRLAAWPFAPAEGRAVVDVLDDPQLRSELVRHMSRAPKSAHTSDMVSDAVTAYRAGFLRGLHERPPATMAP